jgi:hypothetical protein
MDGMFPYDAELLAAVQRPSRTIAGVLQTMRAIDSLTADGDGLKWFNWLYLQVTAAVEQRVGDVGFADPAWLAELDVQFARLYFDALASQLSGNRASGCWRALFDRRNQALVARIQFALAGINAHINHDLALAIVATCRQTNTAPTHDSPQYADYCSVNSTLNGLVDLAKEKLMVRLLGDALPPVSHLEDTVAAWNVAAAREAAWVNAEMLWNIQGLPRLWSRYLNTLDGITAVAGKALLAPVPLMAAVAVTG